MHHQIPNFVTNHFEPHCSALFMKPIIAFIFLCSFGQQLKAQGLIFDEAQYAKREAIEVTRAELPLSASLKKYAPLLYPQVGNTCVAHAFANALTMLYAKKLHCTDRQKITQLCFSPYFIYYRNKEAGDHGCQAGLNIETTAKEVLKNGIAPIVEVEYPNYYPFTDNILCIDGNGDTYPPAMEPDLAAAQHFKMEGIYRVASTTAIKTALANGFPVVLCLYTPPSFRKANSDVWAAPTTEQVDKTKGHALVVVGYDDQKYGGAIEVMNSWGDAWGNKGFTWIRYNDYLKWLAGGYALQVSNGLATATNNTQPSFSPILHKTILKINSNDGKRPVKFNNARFIKAFSDKN